MIKSEKSSQYIYFAVISTSLTAFASGSCFSWTSPMLPKFLSPDPDINPNGKPVTTSESAWIVSGMSVGLIFGPPFSIFCLRFCMKKTSILVSMFPILAANLICCFATHPVVFIFARFLMGLGSGAVWSVLGTYIAEISEDNNRGLLGSMPGLLSNLGSLFVYAVGPYLELRLFSFAIILPIIIFYVTFGFFVPDSPYDLVIKGRHDQAENSLKTLRKSDSISIKKELAFIAETVESGSNKQGQLIDLIKDRGLRKGLLICITLMAIQQLSGILAVVSYAEIIFKQAGDFIPSAISTIILGIVSTIANGISLPLVDKMGRKSLLATSCILQSLSLFALGLFFYRLHLGLDISSISWMPIASLMVYMTAFNLGLGIVPWIVMGEVFHSNVKALASTITAICNFGFTFIVLLCFPYMMDYLGMGWSFWIFAFIMVLGSTFCVVVLPETKGKNFQEIQKLLNGSDIKIKRVKENETIT